MFGDPPNFPCSRTTRFIFSSECNVSEIKDGLPLKFDAGINIPLGMRYEVNEVNCKLVTACEKVK